MSSPENSDRLHSGVGGLYDLSFFAASIRHTAEQSREVFGRLSGGRLSQHTEDWARSSDEDRDAYLLETHEFAHHALMYSTPAGVLLWRLNQVISRDIAFLFEKARKYGIEIPRHRSPRATFTDAAWQRELRAAAGTPDAVLEYIFYVIRSLDDLLRLRSIFFDRDGAATNADLTFGDLRGLLQRAYAYLSDRCEVPFVVKWTSQLPPETKVFPEGRAFNVMDIAEAHAMAAELFVLRAFGDMAGFERRRGAASSGAFGKAFSVGATATSAMNELQLSPHNVQLAAVIACSSSLDVAGEDVTELVIEDALPWWRFTSPKVLDAEFAVETMVNALSLSASPLNGSGSSWLKFVDADLSEPAGDPEKDAERYGNLIRMLTGIGLDLQIYAIHKGAMLNARLFMTMFADGDPNFQPGPFERLSDQEWRAQQSLAVPLIEYKEEFLFGAEILDNIYAADNPIRKFKLYRLINHPDMQLLAHIVNGTTPRENYAAYARKMIPRAEVLREKFARTMARETADLFVRIIEHLFDRGHGIGVDLAHLNVEPDYFPAANYI